MHLAPPHPRRRRSPPPMRLMPRDIELVLAIHAHRILRRDQAQRLLFPSRNTANERLKRLHQHGYLARRRLPVEYGLGSRQALYLLARRGAQLVAQREGLDVAEGWKDTVLLMPGERVRLLLRFEDFMGLYLYHCHNLEHEDQGLMRNYRITAPSTASALRAPFLDSV